MPLSLVLSSLLGKGEGKEEIAADINLSRWFCQNYPWDIGNIFLRDEAIFLCDISTTVFCKGNVFQILQWFIASKIMHPIS